MHRRIPVWLFLLVILLGIVFMVGFGWTVRHVAQGHTFGKIGETAILIAEYPSLLKKTLYQVGVLNEDVTKQLDADHKPIHPQWIKNEFPDIDGFKRRGALPPGVINDSGYLLLSIYDHERNQAIVKLIRINDDSTVHEWVPHIVQAKKPHEMIHHPILLDDGGLLFHWYRTSLQKIDVCAQDVWSIDSHDFHHSNEVGPDGNFWIPTVIKPSPLHQKYGKYKDDGIAKVSQDGKLLSVFSVADILVRHGYRAIAFGSGEYHWNNIHLNDIEPALYSTKYWDKGDILVSMRHPSTVFLYRPRTDEILWLKTGPWIAQHDADFLGESKVVIYGNDHVRGKGEKPFIDGINNVYVYDFSTDTVLLPYKSSMTKADVRTEYEGLQEILPNGDVFIEEQTRGRLLRLSYDEIVWEYTYRISDIYLGMPKWSRYLTEDQVNHILPVIDANDCAN